MRPDKPDRTIRRAKQHRKAMSLPEVLLWHELKCAPQGPRFRRQYPAGDYVLDFFCARANLAIEIDGVSHDMGHRPQRDQARDRWFRENRIDTIRIPASDVLKDPKQVAEAMLAIAAERLALFGKTPPSALRAASCGPRATPSAPPSEVDGEDLTGSLSSPSTCDGEVPRRGGGAAA